MVKGKGKARGGMKPTAGHVTTRLQVVGLRSGAGVGVYGVPAGCKFMVRITLSHTHRRTHFDSQRLPFPQVLLCQSGPQKPLQAFRDSTKSTLTDHCYYSGSFRFTSLLQNRVEYPFLDVHMLTPSLSTSPLSFC